MKEKEKQSLEGEFSGFSLEAWLCGQVRPELEEEVGAWLRTNEQARKQLADLRASNRQTLEKYPADWMMSKLASRLQATRPQPRPGSRLIGKAWLAIPAAAALLLVLLFNPARPQRKAGGRQAADRIIIKGGSAAVDLTGSLQIHRRDKDAIEVLRDGSEARPGELLQLSYWLSTDAYGMIISIDGLGLVTQHFPLEGKENLIRGRKQTFLPYAIELDQAPRFERFYLIIAPRPFAAHELLARIKGSLPVVQGQPLLKLELPPGFVQTALTLVKSR